MDLSFTLCKISILPLVLGLLLRTLFPFLRRWRRTLPSGPVSGVPAVRPGGARGPQEAQQEASGEAHVGRILRCGCGSRQARLFVPGLLRRKAGGGAALQARAERQMLHRLGGRHRIHHRQAHRQAVQGLPVSPVNIMDRGISDFYAVCITFGSYARPLSRRSKNSCITSAGTRSSMDLCGRKRL